MACSKPGKLCVEEKSLQLPLPAWGSAVRPPAGRKVRTPPDHGASPTSTYQVVSPWATHESLAENTATDRQKPHASSKAATSQSSSTCKGGSQLGSTDGPERSLAASSPKDQQNQKHREAQTLHTARTPRSKTPTAMQPAGVASYAQGKHAGHGRTETRVTPAELRMISETVDAAASTAAMAKSRLADADKFATSTLSVSLYSGPGRDKSSKICPGLDGKQEIALVKDLRQKLWRNGKLQEALDAQVARKTCRNQAEREEDKRLAAQVVADVAHQKKAEAEKLDSKRAERVALQEELNEQRKEATMRKKAQRLLQRMSPTPDVGMGTRPLLDFTSLEGVDLRRGCGKKAKEFAVMAADREAKQQRLKKEARAEASWRADAAESWAQYIDEQLVERDKKRDDMLARQVNMVLWPHAEQLQNGNFTPWDYWIHS
eukprot:TRINITY_DN13220_c0_g1_i1.p1 TRINITY_DN13220_c0_g1~~TRINITY_DN13220_c0_g1_i1.p1  ORF type:complete len:432 (-),score=103.13 TRINITY_DN13220_c0_g1_i1:684-1979(-)